jgi:hypothetical protein
MSLEGMTQVNFGENLELMAFEGLPCGANGVLEIHPDGLGEVVHVDLLLTNPRSHTLLRRHRFDEPRLVGCSRRTISSFRNETTRSVPP